ncbi:MAG TPA: hypothetical protein DCP92_10995 [Nitrospiraceae bacterium]|nr:hypothetical protein [Nitrospiraceae bacterium]
MFPFIWTGDKIIVRSEANLNIGDIVVFKRGEEMFCHRLMKSVEIKGISYYQTCGDSLLTPDEPMTINEILGKVIRIERENVPLPRRILLFIFPVLRFGQLNAYVISALLRLKNIFPRAAQDNKMQ